VRTCLITGWVGLDAGHLTPPSDFEFSWLPGGLWTRRGSRGWVRCCTACLVEQVRDGAGDGGLVTCPYARGVVGARLGGGLDDEAREELLRMPLRTGGP
jgi:hypothetical protein